MGQVHVVPADDCVFDQSSASLSDLLLHLLAIPKFLAVAKGNGLGEFVRAFNLVQLLFNGLAEFDVVDISQDENRFDNLAELFQRFVQGMLLRVRIESLEQL